MLVAIILNIKYEIISEMKAYENIVNIIERKKRKVVMNKYNDNDQ